MRLVGPRPETPEFADLDDPLGRAVLTATPGITGAAQLVFADEAALLVGDAPAMIYRERVLPAKLRIDAAYLARRSTRLDLWLLGQTLLALLGRRPRSEIVLARLGLGGPE